MGREPGWLQGETLEPLSCVVTWLEPQRKNRSQTVFPDLATQCLQGDSGQLSTGCLPVLDP